MCFHYKPPEKIEYNNAKITLPDSGDYNGFTHPKAPIYTNSEIELARWGLVPFWAKDGKFAANTLNARIEALEKKPSFRDSVNNRCLVFAAGFYEWKWLDEAGKKKQKYFIYNIDNTVLYFAGLYSDWTNKETGEVERTYTIVTTEADSFMSEIHNHGKRMPVILNDKTSEAWLTDLNPLFFAKPEIKLTANPV